jgi:hypothetical protein
MSSTSSKTTFVVIVSALLLAGFLCTTFMSFFTAREALRSEIKETELPLTGDNIYSEIRRDLIHPVVISSLMATDTFVRDWILGGESDPVQLTRYLKEVKGKYHTYTSFFVSEKSRIYYHADGILKKVSPDEPRDRWYFRVQEMAEDYEINLDPDMANRDAMTVFINHRVLDYEGRFIGATGVGITVGAVKQLIESYQAKYGRKVYFVDKSGAIPLSGSGFDQSVTNISQLSYGFVFDGVLQGSAGGSFSYAEGGMTTHGNIRYIDEWGWYLVVEKNEGKAMAGVYRMLTISLLICFAVTLVITFAVNASITRYQRRIEVLRGILPICAHCGKVRDDRGSWSKFESFVAKHTEAEFSHSICPACMEKHYSDVTGAKD